VQEAAMTLQEIIADIHALNDDLEAYERKYGVLSEAFYESYMSGEEPDDDAWVLDWADWAGAYKILLRRREQYRHAIQSLRERSQTLVEVIYEQP
jgi:cell division protein FtsB